MGGQHRITKSGRNSIVELLVHGFDGEAWEFSTHTEYDIWGCSDPKGVLGRLYPLRDLPSQDPKFRNAEEEIAAIQPDAGGRYPVEWVFRDGRFRLGDGPDDVLLEFLCAVFHPEVRDDRLKKEWTAILGKVNEVLGAAQYALFPRDWIGLQAVYGWRDLTKARFASISEGDLTQFCSLFMGKGDVVGFYRRSDFDDFTRQVVGIPLCQCYESSKGAALRAFLNDCMDETKVLRLLDALMKHGEEHGIREKANALFLRCRFILDRARGTNPAVAQLAGELKAQFNGEYIKAEIEAMIPLQKTNPTDAIGKAKELVESCCKTILERKDIAYDSKWDLQQLVKNTRKALHLMPEDIPERAPAAEAIKQLLSHLGAIAQCMGELRNAYGSGHGKAESFRGLQERHAKLAVGCSSTLASFLWESFEREQQRQTARTGTVSPIGGRPSGGGNGN